MLQKLFRLFPLLWGHWLAIVGTVVTTVTANAFVVFFVMDVLRRLNTFSSAAGAKRAGCLDQRRLAAAVDATLGRSLWSGWGARRQVVVMLRHSGAYVLFCTTLLAAPMGCGDGVPGVGTGRGCRDKYKCKGVKRSDKSGEVLVCIE